MHKLAHARRPRAKNWSRILDSGGAIHCQCSRHLQCKRCSRHGGGRRPATPVCAFVLQRKSSSLMNQPFFVDTPCLRAPFFTYVCTDPAFLRRVVNGPSFCCRENGNLNKVDIWGRPVIAACPKLDFLPSFLSLSRDFAVSLSLSPFMTPHGSAHIPAVAPEVCPPRRRPPAARPGPCGDRCKQCVQRAKTHTTPIFAFPSHPVRRRRHQRALRAPLGSGPAVPRHNPCH